MELRGAPRGRDISEDQAETILNAVLRGSRRTCCYQEGILTELD